MSGTICPLSKSLTQRTMSWIANVSSVQNATAFIKKFSVKLTR